MNWKELNSLFRSLERTKNPEEKKIISSHIDSLKNSLKKINNESLRLSEKISLVKPLPKTQIKPIKKKKSETKPSKKDLIPPRFKTTELEKETLKRLRKKHKKISEKKIKKPSKYVKKANELFSKYSLDLLNRKKFSGLKKNLINTLNKLQREIV